jgi:hypothetical protein
MPRLPRRVLFAMIAMIILTTLPHLIGVASAPAGSTFSGTIVNAPDYHSHLTRMRPGSYGSWLYRLGFTVEEHEPALLQTFYVMLGHVVRWTGLSFDVAYLLARAVFTALMVWALWRFTAHFLSERVAWWALLLCLFGGGVGYLLIFIVPDMTREISPIEFWLQDAYTYFAAFFSPHFAAGIALLVTAFLALDQWTSQGRSGSLATLFLASLAVALIQPFDLILIDIVLVIVAAYRVLRRQIQPLRALAGLILIGISHVAILSYDWIVLYQFPVWRSFTEQNITLSPPPIYYLFGYAPVLLPAVAGAILAIQRHVGRLLVPILWLLLVAVLVYAPLATQRRFLMGIQAPMATLAVFWLAEAAVPWLRKKIGPRYRPVMIGYAVVAVLSTILVFVWLVARTRDLTDRDLYISDAMRSGWQWIIAQTPGDSVLLASFANGNRIAGRTGHRVVLGHWVETADYDHKLAGIQRLFSAETEDEWRLAFLQAQRADYLWYSAEERALGSWQPQSAPYLHPVFESGDVVIFQVVRGD